jgi:hypothetical protein
VGLTALTADEMISGSPHPVLPLVTTKPTFKDITNTQKLLNSNRISIHSLTGGGNHGHLGLVIMVQ